jgi:hypothetical protein
MPVITYSEQVSQPIQAGSRQVSIISRALQIKPPSIAGGLVWNRPVKVRIQDADGQTQLIPIVDVTLQVIATLSIASLVVFLITLLRPRKS